MLWKPVRIPPPQTQLKERVWGSIEIPYGEQVGAHFHFKEIQNDCRHHGITKEFSRDLKESWKEREITVDDSECNQQTQEPKVDEKGEKKMKTTAQQKTSDPSLGSIIFSNGFNRVD